jgi:signal transduction histidine kinase/CheY-like chemotaxis protein
MVAASLTASLACVVARLVVLVGALAMTCATVAVEARAGVGDLTAWNSDSDPVRSLNDGWSFYWDTLVPPDAFAGPEQPPGGVPIRLPAAWDSQVSRDTSHPGRGVATYHPRLYLPAGAPPLAIRLPAIYSASILYANGRPIIVNGRPARGIDAERRIIRDQIAALPEFPPDPPAQAEGRRSVDLVLHVSNYVLAAGGRSREPAIGTSDGLEQQRNRQIVRDLVVVGACGAAGLFFLVLFATRTRERPFLWFGMLCLSIGAAYAHLTDIPFLIDPGLLAAAPAPYLPVAVTIAIASDPLFLSVVASMYPRDLPARWAVVASALLLLYPGILIAGRLLELDGVLQHWTTIRSIAHALVLGCFGLGAAGLAAAAVRRRQGAGAALAATLVLVVAVAHDIAMVRLGQSGRSLVGGALLIFVFAYALILGRRLNAAFAAAETLSQDLGALTRTLEQKVVDRTAELERAARRAEAADRAKSQFLAAANHDLRQPLHAMALIVGVLGNRRADPALREQVDTLKACLAGAQRLLGGILDIAKLDAGAIEPRPRACAIDQVLRQVLAELAPLAARDNVRITLATTRHHVLADADMLMRILGNLVGNAIKFAPAGRVLIGARVRGTRVRIEVRDNGIGIPPAEQERIFEEFHQSATAPEREREGVGLGLAITRRFARLMGSDIELRSTPGRGSCFALVLPRADAPADAATAPSAEIASPGGAAGAPGAGSGLEGLRILVVDDDPIVLKAVTLLLSDWGSRPMTARDGASALALLENGRETPDVLIVDGHLGPEDPGHRVIEAVRQVVGPDLPAAIVTGETTPEGLRALSGLGFPVLHKPIQPGNFASLIRHLARARRVRTELTAAATS